MYELHSEHCHMTDTYEIKIKSNDNLKSRVRRKLITNLDEYEHLEIIFRAASIVHVYSH